MTNTSQNSRASHWEGVYLKKAATAVSWYRDHLETSLALLEQVGLTPQSHVIDVGGGASTLVDDLLDRRVQTITVLDLSAAALAIARYRLSERAQCVHWLTGDVTRMHFDLGAFTHWHDRAVMHFLTADDDVRAYAEQAARAVMRGGHAVIGGFAPDGPERCSGLLVARRSVEDIARILGPPFTLIASHQERHQTPSGAEQSFAYALLRRT